MDMQPAGEYSRTTVPTRPLRQTGPMATPIRPTAGRLLVATPPLVDPNFDRTVVYVVEHRDDGALGVVLNRPSDEILRPPLDRWVDLLGDPAVVFLGGPVEPDGFVGLTASRRPHGTTPVEAVDLSAPPAQEDEGRTVRIFRGYAGWGPGQLEHEIAEGAWIVLDADPADIVGSTPDDLWRSVLRRQSGRLSWLADAPDDLALN
ncbi:MAG: hypothetical protein RLZZ01_1988 [Actinomycetota bacterium]